MASFNASICISSLSPLIYRPQVVRCFHHLRLRLSVFSSLISAKRSSTRSPYVRSSFGFKKDDALISVEAIFCLNVVDQVRIQCAFISPPLTCFSSAKISNSALIISYVLLFPFTCSAISVNPALVLKCKKSSTLDLHPVKWVLCEA